MHFLSMDLVHGMIYHLFHGITACSNCHLFLQHTHAFTAVFPWESAGMKYIREFPVFGFFALSTLAVDVFWMLSGFLCQYQLHYKVNNNPNNTKMSYIWFFINRLLRIYPLFLLQVLMVVTSPMNVKCKTKEQIIKTLFLVEIIMPPEIIQHEYEAVPPPCSGAGWSINTDIHGYIFIILIFGILFKNKSNSFKRYILWSLYLISCVLTMKIITDYDIKWPVWIYGIEQNDPDLYEEYFKTNPEAREQWEDKIAWKYYPDYDLKTPELMAYRERSTKWLYHLYFTSIFKHGAAMFLGCVLAINVIQRNEVKNKNKSMFNDLVKIIIGCVMFYMTMDLRADLNQRPSFWTFAYDKLFIIAVYFVLDAILSICSDDNQGNVLKTIFDLLLANKVWKKMSTYTYGIYLFHIIPVLILAMDPYPADVKNGGIGEDNYGYLFLGKLAGISLGISLIIAFILYWIIEYPMMKFRYKYIRPKYYVQDTKKDE